MNQKIILENGTGAFLRRKEHYLLIKRSSQRKIAPGKWSCPGGHMEPDEINDPMAACLREVHEETGITKEHIYNLELRYIIIRRAVDTIRQNYIYFGETDTADFIDTREGTLHWVPEAELLDREFTRTFDAMLRHYLHTPDEKKRIVAGIAEKIDGTLHMTWSTVEDFEL